jgi:predicted homoserine dehydrogenase-like protein
VLQRPHVLIHYEAPLSITRAARLGRPTVAPMGAPVAETIGYAKRDLVAGQRLDGIGGFDCYGLIVRADEAVRDELVPVGLTQYARLVRPVRQDEPITYTAVEFDTDNLAIDLRRQQDHFFGGSLAARTSGADVAHSRV